MKDKYPDGDIRVIGSGSFGKVLAVKKLEGHNILRLALKGIETPKQEFLLDTINELTSLADLLKHPTIIANRRYLINTVNLGNTGTKIFHQSLIEMLLAGSSLESLLTRYRGLEEKEVVVITIQIALGLNYE